MKQAINPCAAPLNLAAGWTPRDTTEGTSNGNLVTREEMSSPLTMVMGHKRVEEKGRVKKTLRQ